MRGIFSRALCFLVVFALCIVHLGVIPVASAATHTWDGGGADDNWTTGANWVGDVAPSAGDTLIFSGSTRVSPINDFAAGTVFESIIFNSPNFTVSGNSIELTPSAAFAIRFNTLSTTYDIETTISGSSSKSVYATGNANNISGNLVLNLTGGADMNFVTDSSNTLTVSGTISGSTDIFIVGPSSFVTFSSSNTFTSNSIATGNGSYTTCSASNCFGASIGDINMNGGTINFNATMTVANGINSLDTGNTATLNINADTTLSGALQLTGNAIIQVASGIEGTLSGNINIDAAQQLTLIGTGDLANDFIHQNGGAIFGDGSLSVSGVNAVIHGNNAYTGTTYATNAVLDIRDTNSLGTTAGYTTIDSGATLLITSTMTLGENIRIEGVGATGYSGAVEMSAGNNTELSGTITLQANATIANTSGGFELMLSGITDGTGNLTLESDSNTSYFSFSGSTPNTYVGSTTVNGSILYLGKDTNIIAIPGNLIVNAEGGNDALVWAVAEQQIANNASVALNDIGSYRAILRVDTGLTESIGGLSGDGHLQIYGTRVVVESNTDQTFSGTIYGPGILNKQGTGTLTLSGDFADSGGGFPSGVEIHEGRIDANATNTSFEFATWTITGGTLSGTQTIGSTNMNGGRFAPGNSPGCLNVSGNLTFSINARFQAEIGGTAQCVSYDHSAVSGTATLTGAYLDIVNYGGFTPTLGNSFTILSAASINGTFNDLPNNATVIVGAFTYRVNYTSTQVILTNVENAPIPQTTTLVNTGTSVVLQSAFGALLIVAAIITLRIPRRN